MFNNNFGMARGTTCGMATTEGVFTVGPGATNSMTPLTKFHDGPNPPSKCNVYMTHQNRPSANESSDTYIMMNPARTAIFSSQVPPPEYNAYPDGEKLYAEIPGEYLPFSKGEYTGEQAQYGNIPCSDVNLQLQHAEDSGNKEHVAQDAVHAEKFENACN